VYTNNLGNQNWDPVPGARPRRLWSESCQLARLSSILPSRLPISLIPYITRVLSCFLTVDYALTKLVNSFP
jgi:hypothetical protein